MKVVKDRDIIIDGVPLPTPTSMEVLREKIWSTNTTRASNGDLVGDVKTRKWKINLGWNVLSEDKCQKILQIMEPDFISVSFFNPLFQQRETRKFYGGELKTNVYNYAVEGNEYDNCTVNLIEK